MSVSNQIEEQIAAVVQPLMDDGVEIVSPNRIADIVDQRIDPNRVAPETKTYAAIMYLRDRVRKYLAHHFDPVEKAQRFVEDEEKQSDLFSEFLQDYYPVKREVEGESALVYARRETLTEIDARRIASRMKKAGESLIQHADALIAYVTARAS